MKLHKLLKQIPQFVSNQLWLGPAVAGQQHNYKPSVLLPSSLLMTLYDVYMPIMDAEFRRERVYFDDGGHISLDWAQEPTECENPPLLMIMHGLTGGSETNYIRVLADRAVKEKFRCVCINSRGINSQMTSPFPFIGYDFHQFEAALKRVSELYPKTPIYLIGTSLGGNLLLRYLLKHQNQRIKGFVGLSVPFDITSITNRMSTMYQNYFVKSFIERTMLSHPAMKHWEDIGLLNFQEIKKVATIRDFHSEVTTKIFGFKHVDEFFDGFLISKQMISSLKYPTFFMTAKDDPIVYFNDIPLETINQNKKIRMLVTERGGHLCWFKGVRPERWYPDPVFEFLSELRKKQSL